MLRVIATTGSDIQDNCGNNIKSKDLDNFKGPLYTIQHETSADKTRTSPDRIDSLKSVLRLRSKILLPRSYHLKRVYNKEDSKNIRLMPPSPS